MFTGTRLRAFCFISGIALVGSARAAAPPAPTHAELAAIRAHLKAHADRARIYGKPAVHAPKLADLALHHQATSAAGGHLVLLQRDGITIELGDAHGKELPHVVDAQGKRRTASPGDLDRVELTSKEALEHAVAARILEISKARGGPAHDVEQAHAFLVAETQTIQTLWKGAIQHPEVQLLVRHAQVTKGARGLRNIDVVIARSAAGVLSYSAHGYKLEWTGADGTKRDAKASDLVLLDATKPARFDALVAQQQRVVAGPGHGSPAVALEQQIEDATLLDSHIKDPGLHPRVKALIDGGVVGEARLGTYGDVTIFLALTRVRSGALGFGRSSITAQIVQRDGKHEASQAGVWSLEKIGAGTRPAFDAAIAEASTRMTSAELRELVTNPMANEDIALLSEAFHGWKSASPKLLLAEHGSERLELRQSGDHSGAIEIVRVSGDKAVRATAYDVVEFGMKDVHALEAAFHAAIVQIAPEDLP